MNWLPIVRYIIARTREPSIVHRAVAAIGGLVAALSLFGPEKWVALVVSGSALVGIFMPDAVQSGYNDASQDVGETTKPDHGQAAVDVATQTTIVHQSGSAPERRNPAADSVRDTVPTQRPFQRYRDPDDDRTPPDSGWNG